MLRPWQGRDSTERGEAVPSAAMKRTTLLITALVALAYGATATVHTPTAAADHSGLCSWAEVQRGCTTSIVFGGGTKCRCPVITTPEPNS